MNSKYYGPMDPVTFIYCFKRKAVVVVGLVKTKALWIKLHLFITAEGEQ